MEGLGLFNHSSRGIAILKMLILETQPKISIPWSDLMISRQSIKLRCIELIQDNLQFRRNHKEKKLLESHL